MKAVVALPVDEAVARICRDYLKTARSCLPRVHDPKDTEGLHDFRVALRRLRSYLRSYRSALHGAIPDKSYRQLKKLASRTNQARDVEVMLAWLDSEIPQLSSRQQVGALWWRKRLEEQHRILYERLEDKLDEEFSVLAVPLEKSLQQLAKRPLGKRSFARSTATRIMQLAHDLDMELNEIRSMKDVEPVHQARITGKKLRYLLEPPSKSILVCNHAVEGMKIFQDLFGNLNDCFVRQEVMHEVVTVAAAEWSEQQLQQTINNGRVTLTGSKVMPGLLAIARRNHSAGEAYYRQIERNYLHGGRERLMKQLNGVVELLKS